MTTVKLYSAASAAQPKIVQLCARNSAIHVLTSAFQALVRNPLSRKERPPDAARLSMRMRNDIGLHTEPDMPDKWDLLR